MVKVPLRRRRRQLSSQRPGDDSGGFAADGFEHAFVSLTPAFFKVFNNGENFVRQHLFVFIAAAQKIFSAMWPLPNRDFALQKPVCFGAKFPRPACGVRPFCRFASFERMFSTFF